MNDIYKDPRFVNDIADIAEDRIKAAIEMSDSIEPRIAIDMAIEEILQFYYKYTMLSVYANEEDAYTLLNKRLSKAN